MHEFCNTLPADTKGEADHLIANNLALLAGLLQSGDAARGASLGMASVSPPLRWRKLP
jgi:hypothetical protein